MCSKWWLVVTFTSHSLSDSFTNELRRPPEDHMILQPSYNQLVLPDMQLTGYDYCRESVHLTKLVLVTREHLLCDDRTNAQIDNSEPLDAPNIHVCVYTTGRVIVTAHLDRANTMEN